jgi:hypothetical protein
MNKYTKYTKTVFEDGKRFDVLVKPAVFGLCEPDYGLWTVTVYEAKSRRTSGIQEGREKVLSTVRTKNPHDALREGERLIRHRPPAPKPPVPKPERLIVTASQYFGSGVVGVHWTQTDDNLEAHIEARKWAYENKLLVRNGFYEFGLVDAAEMRRRFPNTRVGTGGCSGYDYESPSLPGEEAPSLKRCKAALAAGCTTVSGAWQF